MSAALETPEPKGIEHLSRGYAVIHSVDTFISLMKSRGAYSTASMLIAGEVCAVFRNTDLSGTNDDATYLLTQSQLEEFLPALDDYPQLKSITVRALRSVKGWKGHPALENK